MKAKINKALKILFWIVMTVLLIAGTYSLFLFIGILNSEIQNLSDPSDDGPHLPNIGGAAHLVISVICLLPSVPCFIFLAIEKIKQQRKKSGLEN